MHIAPGAVFITSWIPPVLTILLLQLQQLYLPPSLCPRPALHCVWTGRHSGRSLKALVQDQTDSDYRQKSGKIWRIQILWSCRNPNVGIAETNSSSCRVLSPVRRDRWTSGKRVGDQWWSSWFDIKRIMEQFLEQTIVLLEIHCYLLCSAESTLDWIGLDLLSGIMSMALHAENWDLWMWEPCKSWRSSSMQGPPCKVPAENWDSVWEV